MIQRIRFGSPEAITADRNQLGFMPRAKDRGEALANCHIHFNSYMGSIPTISEFPDVMDELGVEWEVIGNGPVEQTPNDISVVNPELVIGTIDERNIEGVVALGSALLRLGNKVGPGNEILEFLDLTATLAPGRHALHA